MILSLEAKSPSQQKMSKLLSAIISKDERTTWPCHWHIVPGHRDLPTMPGWCHKTCKAHKCLSNTQMKKGGSKQGSHQHPHSLQLWDATSKNTHTAQGGSIATIAVSASCAAAPWGKALSGHTKSQRFLKGLLLHSH